MSALQKEVYRSILSRCLLLFIRFHAELIICRSECRHIAEHCCHCRRLKSECCGKEIQHEQYPDATTEVSRSLVFVIYVSDKALQRCLQHPYLVSRNIEPSDLTPKDTHEKLIGASAKLVMLHAMLPKLRARGHRVLLFSQASIPLSSASMPED